MAPASSKAHPPRARKRVEVETTSLKRTSDGSAFTRCRDCNKDVPVGLIDMHSCSLDSLIKMNLETHVLEKVTEVKKPTQRKKTAPTGREAQKSKKVKDPNIPKRPPTAFFLFMDDFRKAYKEANPDSESVASVAKEGGDKWKSMTAEEKKPYLDKALELKAEYEKTLENSNVGNEEEQLITDGED